MEKINNVNVAALREFAAEIERDAGVARKQKSVTGRWVFEDGKPQFTAELQHHGGALTAETDFAPFMGGAGLRPDPISYCMFGFASCFAGTFATVAASEGVELTAVEVTIENEVDLSRAMGVADRPVTEGMTATLRVESDAPPEKLEELRRMAEERCPGVYCITHAIPFTAKIVT